MGFSKKRRLSTAADSTWSGRTAFAQTLFDHPFEPRTIRCRVEMGAENNLAPISQPNMSGPSVSTDFETHTDWSPLEDSW